MSGVLKPCPFCGGHTISSGGDDAWVGSWCEDCGAMGPNHYGKYEWNTRADDTDQLKKACDEWAEVSQANYQRAKAAEDKLAMALDGFEELARLGNGDCYGNSFGNLIAQSYIAELTGGNDD